MNDIGLLIDNALEDYLNLEDKKLELGVYSDAIHESFERLNVDRIEESDMLVHYKTRSEKKFKPEIYDYFDDIGMLLFTTDINKNMEEQYSIKDFRIEKDHYIRPNPRYTDEYNNTKKEKAKNIERSISSYSLSELLSLYQAVKFDIGILEQKYNSSKANLHNYMSNNEIKSLPLNHNLVKGSFSLTKKQPDYDVKQIFSNTIKKSIQFVYFCFDNEIYLEDLHTGKTLMFPYNEEIIYETHNIRFEENTLFIDGIPMNNRTHVESKRKNKDKILHQLFQQGWSVAEGEIKISGESFFRICPISMSKVDKLIDNGSIKNPKEIEELRFIESEDDITKFIEIVPVDSDRERRAKFHDKIIQRSETQRKRNA